MTTKREGIVSMLVDEAKAAIRRGESRSDFEAVGRISNEEIESRPADDPKERDWDWASASLELPKLKVGIHPSSTPTSSIFSRGKAAVTRHASTPPSSEAREEAGFTVRAFPGGGVVVEWEAARDETAAFLARLEEIAQRKPMKLKYGLFGVNTTDEIMKVLRGDEDLP